MVTTLVILAVVAVIIVLGVLHVGNRDRINDLEQQLGDARMALDVSSTALANELGASETLRVEHQTALAELADTIGKNHELRGKVELLEQESGAAAQFRAELAAQLSSAQADYAAEHVSAEELVDECDTLIDENAKLVVENTSLREKLRRAKEAPRGRRKKPTKARG